MKTKREDIEIAVDEEGAAKKQKLVEQPSSQLAFENPLLPLASYDDDYEDEEDYRRVRGGIELANTGIEDDRNGHNNNEVGGDDEEEDDEEDRDAEGGHVKRNRTVELRRDCPYLDTVNRQVLDFDFEKFCSVSLSNLNVYACLVCGKYYQGRGHKSHAYTHSLEADHHVYINLRTEKVFCLPDGYEVIDT